MRWKEMRWKERIHLRLRTQFRRERVEAELDEELRYHVERQIEQNITAGITPHDARRSALRQFGGIEQIKEDCRDRRGVAFVETIIQDLRYTLRSMRKSPGFSLMAVLTLALGIGASTAVFSIADGTLLRDLPVTAPEQLVEVLRTNNSGARMSGFPYPTLEDFRNNASGYISFIGFSQRWVVMRVGAVPDRVLLTFVTGNYFPSLGVTPFLGRTIVADDDRDQSPNPVAVLSYGFWSRRFGADPSVIGRQVRLNETPVTIVGVMPRNFPGLNRLEVPDAMAPISLAPKVGWDFLEEHNSWTVRVVGRIRPGVPKEQARAELEASLQQTLAANAEWISRLPEVDQERELSQRIDLEPAQKGLFDIRLGLSDPVRVLSVVVLLVLLIACANVAGLVAARAAARTQELGLRVALGAGKKRLVRQLLTECVLLAFVGGLAGLLVAVTLHRILLRFVSIVYPFASLEFHADHRVLGFALALSLATAILFGAIPALRASDVNVFAVLRSSLAQAARSGRKNPARAFVTAQVAVSLALLVVAGLFLRSLRNLHEVDTGFEPEQVLLATVDATLSRYKGWPGNNLHFELSERLESLPGVEAVGLATNQVFGVSNWQITIWADGYEYAPGESQLVRLNEVGPGFFRTVGIPILGGREFNRQDGSDSPLAAIVNDTMAQRYYPGENPIGKRFGNEGAGSERKYEIVGVVADTKYGSLRENLRPMVYLPLLQDRHTLRLFLHVRSSGSLSVLAEELRRETAAIDGRLMVYDVRTLDEQLERSLMGDRAYAVWSSLFGAVALVLVCVGFYGVVAYGVAQRTREFGVRMALGSTESRIVRLVLRDTVPVVAVGVGIGLAGGIAVAQVVRNRLFGLTPWDPVAVIGAVLVLIIVAVLACAHPARRAARVDPMTALRCE